MQKRLTKRLIDSLQAPKEKFAIVWDDKLKGFGVRVMPSGLKTYILDYRDKHRRQHRIKLARHGVMTPYEARREARKKLNHISSGGDPLEERETARGATTFRTLAEEYIRYRCAEKKSGPEDERVIRRELLPHWGRKLASDIRRQDVMNLTDEIRKRGAGIMANRTVSIIRRLYNWGIDRELVDSNPAIRVKPRAKENPRDRALSPEEIKAFWNNLDRLPGEASTLAAMRLILTTSQRGGEVVSLEWSEIDDEGWWTIPKEKSKNGLAHRVFLSPLALELLDSLPYTHEGFVFPSPQNPTKHISRHAMARLLNRHRSLLEIHDRFTPHDLRRSSATQMASMGISRLVIAKILNHVETNVTSTYDRHSYDSEKQAALLAWSARLSDIISGKRSKVIRLLR